MLSLRVASAAALAEPDVAARWAEPKISAATKRPTGLPRRIGTRWVRHDPDAAMAWLESLPAGKDREDGVTETYRDWLRRDPEAAVAWLEGREMVEWNEPAFYVYARALSTQKPKQLLEMAERFSDDNLKESAQIYVLRAWIRTDPEAAEAWIAEESTMPEGWVRRARLLRKPPPVPRQKPGGAATDTLTEAS
jgi:hypothetical protein